MKDGGEKAFAAAFAVFVHLVVVGGVYGGTRLGAAHASGRAAKLEDSKLHIEAGLAVKSKSAKGRKSKQPQKESARKVSPNDVAVDRDKPEDPNKPKRPEDKDPLGEIDPESVFDKHRKGAESPPVDEASAEPGADDESKTGKTDGSDFGLLEDAKGDPYVGELIGRIMKDWEVPSTVPEGTGLLTLGCVRLDADGKIVSRKLEDKSANPAFNSAVDRQLRNASDMEAPVPDHLKKLLVQEGACIAFKH